MVLREEKFLNEYAGTGVGTYIEQKRQAAAAVARIGCPNCGHHAWRIISTKWRTGDKSVRRSAICAHCGCRAGFVPAADVNGQPITLRIDTHDAASDSDSADRPPERESAELEEIRGLFERVTVERNALARKLEGIEDAAAKAVQEACTTAGLTTRVRRECASASGTDDFASLANHLLVAYAKAKKAQAAQAPRKRAPRKGSRTVKRAAATAPA